MYSFHARRDGAAFIVAIGIILYAMLIPADASATWPELFKLLDIGCNYFPFPCRIAASTSSPPLIQAALIMSVVGAFIAAPSYIYWFLKGRHLDAVRGNTKLMASGWVFIILALFPFYPGGSRTTTSRLELLLLASSQSRIGLAAFSIFFFVGELAILLACAIWLKSVFTKKEN